MPAPWKLPLLAAFASSTAVAQTTVVDFLMIGKDYFDSVGSVVKIESSITTVRIGCDPHAPTSTCPVADPTATVIQGPSTYQWIQENYLTRNCDLNPTNEVYSCVETTSDDGSVSSRTIAGEGYTDFLYAVTVTEGADKLPTGLTRQSNDNLGPGVTGPPPPNTTSGQTNAPVTTTSTAMTTSGAKTTPAAKTTSSNAAARPVATQNAALFGVGLAALAVAL